MMCSEILSHYLGCTQGVWWSIQYPCLSLKFSGYLVNWLRCLAKYSILNNLSEALVVFIEVAEICDL